MDHGSTDSLKFEKAKHSNPSEFDDSNTEKFLDGLGYPFCRKLIKSCELDESYRPLSSVFGHLMLRNDKYYGRMKNDDLTKIFLEFDFSSRDELLCLEQIVKRDLKKTPQSENSPIFDKLLNQINTQEANPNVPIGKKYTWWCREYNFEF